MIIQENQIWLEETIDKIRNKMAIVRERSRQKIPYTTVAGIHDDKLICGDGDDGTDGINWWTNGFWGGIMWLLYQETKDKIYQEIARYSELKLDKCFEDFYGLHHDVGFMWLPTAVANYRLTGDLEAKRRGLHAANILAGRFNLAGNFIRAWNDVSGKDRRGWAIIDCMMNLPLLYWASEETNDPRFKQIAMAHADRAMETFIRPDGSSHHIVEFDSFTGEMVKAHGGQGYGEGSSWTRGQAWAIYGFLISYIHTKKQEYLDVAKRCAHYFMANIPDNGLIPVDFRQPEAPSWEDSTAAAIAACGLIELSKYVGDFEREMYLKKGVKLLQVLSEQRCDWFEETDNILNNCTAAYHDNQHHFSIIYGDYFFIEGMMKLKGNDVFFW